MENFFRGSAFDLRVIKVKNGNAEQKIQINNSIKIILGIDNDF